MTRDNGALTADILHTWQRLGDNRSTFCFAVDRDHARQLKEQFEAAGVPSAYIGCLTKRRRAGRIAGTQENRCGHLPRLARLLSPCAVADANA